MTFEDMRFLEFVAIYLMAGLVLISMICWISYAVEKNLQKHKPEHGILMSKSECREQVLLVTGITLSSVMIWPLVTCRFVVIAVRNKKEAP